jgi:hypothetical protein
MQFFKPYGALRPRLSRADALWMINEMDWTPESLSDEDERQAFVEAIARFNLREQVAAARQRNAAPPSNCAPWSSTMGAVGTGETHESSEAGACPRVGAAEEDLAQMELVESPTERISSSESESEGGYFDTAAGPPTPGRAPPDTHPADTPGSKRKRPRSCFRHLTSPVLRQAASLAVDGTFEDYDGLIFKRASTVLFPSLEMVFLAVLQVCQATHPEWLLTLTEVRNLTTCSKWWAGERPRCLSLQVKYEVLDNTRAPSEASRLHPAENILQAHFVTASLAGAAPRASADQASRQGSLAAQEAAASEDPLDLPAPRHLATMEWIPSSIDPILDKTPPSVPSCSDIGPRQGSLVQDRLSGCGVPFALHDLPGRCDGGRGVGRSIHTQTIGSMERVCESNLQTPAQTTHTIVSMENERCLSAHVRTWLCGSWLSPGG